MPRTSERALLIPFCIATGRRRSSRNSPAGQPACPFDNERSRDVEAWQLQLQDHSG
jgi:hypothetical protein